MYHIQNYKGPAPTSKEIASHYNVIMMAGAVTTATFLSGAVYYLCHYRQALQKLQNEMRNTFSTIESINSKDLLKCAYLNAVVEEGLRIYPPAGAAHLSRIVPKGGCEISGRFIPGGVRLPFHYPCLVTSSPYVYTYHRLAYPFIPGLFCETRRTSMRPSSSSPNAGLRLSTMVKWRTS